MRVCPFCQTSELGFEIHTGTRLHRVKCENTRELCGGTGPWRVNKVQAEKAWDYRPIQQRIEMSLLKGEKL